MSIYGSRDGRDDQPEGHWIQIEGDGVHVRIAAIPGANLDESYVLVLAKLALAQLRATLSPPASNSARFVTKEMPAMSTYRKKPVVIEAHQWWKNGDHPEDRLPPADKILAGERTEGALVRYFRHPDASGADVHERCGRIWHDHGWIDTLEGGHNVCPGDWVITGVQGEHYPCKPDIFEQTYEPTAQSTGDPVASTLER